MISTEHAELTVTGASVLTVGLGGALSGAVGWAAWEAMAPGYPGRVGAWVWVALKKCLRFALVALVLVAGSPFYLLRFVWRAMVTYLHLYRGSRTTGRRFKGMGRRSQPPGRHRVPAWG